MHPLVLASIFIVSGVMAEALCAGKEPGVIMKDLHQPRWALPLAAWYGLGLFYYAMCFMIAYRMQSARSAVPLVLLAGVMLANAAWNLIFFRLRALRWSLWFYLPYIFLFAALLYAASRVDRVSAVLLLVYSAYLPYALAWSYSVLKLNSPLQPEN